MENDYTLRQRWHSRGNDGTHLSKFSAENPCLFRQREESGFCFSFPDDGKDSYKFFKKESLSFILL